eukprot:scaffold5245_cov183-Ochromonas_danica.AAC.11
MQDIACTKTGGPGAVKRYLADSDFLVLLERLNAAIARVSKKVKLCINFHLSKLFLHSDVHLVEVKLDDCG